MTHEQLIDETNGTFRIGDRDVRPPRGDCIELYQVHVPDPDVPYEDTVGAFVVPIAGTSKIAHADDNIDAAFVRLTGDDVARLSDIAAP